MTPPLLCWIPIKKKNEWHSHQQQQKQLLRSLHAVENVNAHNNSLQWWMLELQRRTVQQLTLPVHFIVLCRRHSQASYTRFALRCHFTDSRSDKLNFEDDSRLNFLSSTKKTTGLLCKGNCNCNARKICTFSSYTSSHVNLATRERYKNTEIQPLILLMLPAIPASNAFI